MRKIQIVSGCILLLVLLSCLAFSPERIVERLNKRLHKNIAEYMHENPLSLAVPAYMGTEKLWFWNAEKNFIFSDISFQNGQYAIDISAWESDLDWFQNKILHGIKGVKTNHVEDPDYSYHESVISEILQTKNAISIQQYCKEEKLVAFITWYGFIYIQVTVPNDFIRIMKDEGDRIYIDDLSAEHKQFLEKIFLGREVMIEECDWFADYRSTESYHDSVPEEECFSLQLSDAYVNDGILLYCMQLRRENEANKFFPLCLTNVSIEFWKDGKWQLVPQKEQSIMENYYFGRSQQIPYFEKKYGSVFLADFEYMESGSYRLILEFNSREVVLMDQFKVDSCNFVR